MSEELLDIVDEYNNLTGQSHPRSIVHTNNLLHRTVHIHILNSKKDFLVQKRSLLKDLSPGKFDLGVGGHITSKDEITGAAIKELEEEMGIRASLDNLFPGPIHRESFGKCSAFIHRFFYIFEKDLNDLNFNDGEVDSVKWMTKEEILRDKTINPTLWSFPEGVFQRSSDWINFP